MSLSSAYHQYEIARKTPQAFQSEKHLRQAVAPVKLPKPVITAILLKSEALAVACLDAQAALKRAYDARLREGKNPTVSQRAPFDLQCRILTYERDGRELEDLQEQVRVLRARIEVLLKSRAEFDNQYEWDRASNIISERLTEAEANALYRRYEQNQESLLEGCRQSQRLLMQEVEVLRQKTAQTILRPVASTSTSPLEAETLRGVDAPLDLARQAAERAFLFTE